MSKHTLNLVLRTSVALVTITFVGMSPDRTDAQLREPPAEQAIPTVLTGFDRARQIYAEILGPWTLIELESQYRERDARRWDDLLNRWNNLPAVAPQRREEMPLRPLTRERRRPAGIQSAADDVLRLDAADASVFPRQQTLVPGPQCDLAALPEPESRPEPIDANRGNLRSRCGCRCDRCR